MLFCYSKLKLIPIGLAFATIMIMVRCTFRAIELYGGFDSEMANDEVLYMILEPPMISLAAIALTVFHPGVCFQGAWLATSTRNPKKDGKQEMFEREESESRNSYLSPGEGGDNGIIERGESY